MTNKWLIGSVTIAMMCYMVAGVSEGFRANWWWFGFWASYACANFFWLKATHVF